MKSLNQKYKKQSDSIYDLFEITKEKDELQIVVENLMIENKRIKKESDLKISKSNEKK